MIASVWFDDIIVVPGGKTYGGASERSELREQSFHAADGWQIQEALPGVFTLFQPGMVSPVTVGGYGYTLVREEPAPLEEPEPTRKRARR